MVIEGDINVIPPGLISPLTGGTNPPVTSLSSLSGVLPLQPIFTPSGSF